jgi:DNA polymerase-3 subunit alpha
MPYTPGMSMSDMLNAEQQGGTLTELTRLLAEDEEAREVWKLAKEMEGLARSVGRHAGGIVIAPDKLTRYSPLYYQSDSNFASTHFDKDDIESVGLVKFDFLGLRTLTVIDKAIKKINRANPGMQEPLDIGRISLEDQEVYTMLGKAKTVAVFQLESEGMRDLLLRYKPTEFEDLIVLISLYRPGPLEMGMHTDYVERRNGNQHVDYYHVSALKPILQETYGVFLYQEQVMQAARVLADYSLGQADILRRAMGKKKRDEMARQREQFVSGANQKGLDKKTADNVFDVMEKFSGYGFNKSHAAAYALIAYRTAWLKTHYPSWFMAAEMSTLMGSTDTLETLIRECKQLRIEVVPPNINISHPEFEVDKDGRVVYGLSAIKDIGRGFAETICKERGENGPYKHLLDFCLRIPRESPCNQGMLERLICAGCFDAFGQTRPELMQQVSRVLSVVAGRRSLSENGVSDMFGSSGSSPDSEALDYVLQKGEIEDWNEIEKLRREKLSLGLYMSGHPLNSYQNLLRRHSCVPIADLKSYTDTQSVCIAASVSGLRKIRSKTMLINLSDSSGVIELKLNPKRYAEYREYAVVGKILLIKARIAKSQYSTADHGLSCIPYDIKEITDPPEGDIHKPKSTDITDMDCNMIVVHADPLRCTTENLEAMNRMLSAAPKGQCALRIRYLHSETEIDFDLQQRVDPNKDLLTNLRNQWGEQAVRLERSN